MEIEETTLTKQSKFNSGIAQINRLNFLLEGCTLANMEADVENYRVCLDRLFMELSSDMNKMQFNKAEEHHKKIEDALVKQDEKTLWNYLWKFEIFLRRVQTAQGKLASHRDLEEGDYE